MPRKSLAEDLLNQFEEEDKEGDFLVIYDFPGKTKAEFYHNLKRIFAAQADGGLVQRSVVHCCKLKTAKSAKALAAHYGAKTLLYEVKGGP